MHNNLNPEPLIILRDIAKRYHEHIVYRDLNAQFQTSERVALLGRSGCGKTTLLNLISGIDLPDAGTIHIKGEDITALNETDRTLFRRKNIGFIFQFFNLIPTLTVLENLLLPLELMQKNTPQYKQYALDLLNEVGLIHLLSRFPQTLSGGEQQRVAIVRALVHEPILILADEPTGNLDSETSKHTLTLLDSMLRKTNASLLMVTHSIETASITNRKLSIHNGQLCTT